ncbi:MAG: glycosyltransferase family 2 protein [Bryobacteraceae bacterium]|jgi:cellulose synthase/poly-beta-1,6-N-acetylglucosamine synthase-like glycosyltransferase
MLAAVLLAVASAIVFYIIAGYPILLAFFTRRAAPPVRKDKNFRATVSVLMAVHNGEEFIRGKLECLLGLDYPAHLVEILVVSDGSTDATEAIAESFADRGVRLIRAPRGGKAATLNVALRQVSGEILFFTDVRQALDPHALSHLVANFADPSIGAVTGELRILNPDSTGEEADMKLYRRYELFARRRHSRIDSTFSATGCIYAIRRSLTAPIPPNTLSDDVAIPLRAFFRGNRVIVDPEAIAFDHPTSEGGEFRRKLRTLAGLWQVHARLPELFTSANRMRLDFLSHRFARLALPWAILLVWAATMALPASPFRRFLLIDELALVALAALDYLVPKGLFLKRVSSPARTFFAMNLAPLLAIAVFVVPPETLWRPTRVKVRRR